MYVHGLPYIQPQYMYMNTAVPPWVSSSLVQSSGPTFILVDCCRLCPLVNKETHSMPGLNSNIVRANGTGIGIVRFLFRRSNLYIITSISVVLTDRTLVN